MTKPTVYPAAVFCLRCQTVRLGWDGQGYRCPRCQSTFEEWEYGWIFEAWHRKELAQHELDEPGIDQDEFLHRYKMVQAAWAELEYAWAHRMHDTATQLSAASTQPARAAA